MLTYAVLRSGVADGRSGNGAALARNALQARRYSVYLLYWYKSTNTDAEGAAGGFAYLNFDWAQHSIDLKKIQEQPNDAAALHWSLNGRNGSQTFDPGLHIYKLRPHTLGAEGRIH